MSYQHETLAAGRWAEFSLMEQLANIGGEVERTMSWRRRNNAELAGRALDRALELLDMTLADPRHKLRLKELTRMREALLDFFLGDNQFGSTDQAWRRYFLSFGLAARRRK
jgi:hypothetical protein